MTPVDHLPPIHPGRFLRKDLDSLGLTARKFADHIHVPHNAVTAIMNGDRSITAQMAIRLSKAFGTTAQYWLNLQTIYDLKRAQADMPAEGLQIRWLERGPNPTTLAAVAEVETRKRQSRVRR